MSAWQFAIPAGVLAAVFAWATVRELLMLSGEVEQLRVRLDAFGARLPQRLEELESQLRAVRAAANPDDD